MSNAVHTSIVIPAPPERVWDLVMDPTRLSDWVTIHQKLESYDEDPPHEGFEMVQRLHLRGFDFRVKWELVECQKARRAVWEGHGPARSHAHTEYRLRAEDDGTFFDYLNEFKAPLGLLGAAASRAIVGGLPEREATHSLEKLKSLFA